MREGMVSSPSQSKASTASLFMISSMISSLVSVGDRRARSSVSAAISWLLPSLTTDSSNSLIRVMIPEVEDEVSKTVPAPMGCAGICLRLPVRARGSAIVALATAGAA